jgi:hypothetical protein
MHGGFIYGDHTTGSYIAALGQPIDNYWVTGSSTPCLSLFKPLWLIANENITFRENNATDAISYWKVHEELHRCILEHRIAASDYIKQRDRLEKSLSDKVAEIQQSSLDPEILREIMTGALSSEKDLLDHYLLQAKNRKSAISGNVYFKRYWSKMNHKLRQD